MRALNWHPGLFGVHVLALCAVCYLVAGTAARAEDKPGGKAPEKAAAKTADKPADKGITADDKVTVEATANWNEEGHFATAAVDGDAKTYWCTDGHQPGEGPTRERPDWLLLKFSRPITATTLTVHGRSGYGPKDFELQASDDGEKFRTVKTLEGKEKKPTEATFDATTSKYFRLIFYSAYDAKSSDSPRHVAVQEITLGDGKQAWPAPNKQPSN